MSAPSYTYSLTNGATADAAQVMQNYNDILNGVTDGTKDLTVNAFTANGAVSFKGTVALGDAAADDITITGSLASTIAIKTTNTYNIGSATLGLAGVYFGTGSTTTARIVATGTIASSRTYTLLDAGAAANFVLSEGAATINGVKTFGDVTDTTSAATGAIICAGGIGVAKKIWAGTGLLFGQSASTGTGVSVTGSTQAAYEEITHTTTVTNMLASPPAITFHCVRVGKLVTITQTATVSAGGSKNNTSDPQLTDVLPTTFRPTTALYLMCWVNAGGVAQSGVITLSTGGQMTWQKQTLIAWVGAVAADLYQTTWSFVTT